MDEMGISLFIVTVIIPLVISLVFVSPYLNLRENSKRNEVKLKNYFSDDELQVYNKALTKLISKGKYVIRKWMIIFYINYYLISLLATLIILAELILSSLMFEVFNIYLKVSMTLLIGLFYFKLKKYLTPIDKEGWHAVFNEVKFENPKFDPESIKYSIPYSRTNQLYLKIIQYLSWKYDYKPLGYLENKQVIEAYLSNPSKLTQRRKYLRDQEILSWFFLDLKILGLFNPNGKWIIFRSLCIFGTTFGLVLYIQDFQFFTYILFGISVISVIIAQFSLDFMELFIPHQKLEKIVGIRKENISRLFESLYKLMREKFEELL